jgi:hypothetical protein
MKEIPVVWKNTVWGIWIQCIIHGYVNANSSKLFNKVSNSSCAFAFTVAGKDRLILFFNNY